MIILLQLERVNSQCLSLGEVPGDGDLIASYPKLQVSDFVRGIELAHFLASTPNSNYHRFQSFIV